MKNLPKTGTKDFSDVKLDKKSKYLISHLFNIQGGENEWGGGTKVVKSVNMEVWINKEVEKNLRSQ